MSAELEGDIFQFFSRRYIWKESFQQWQNKDFIKCLVLNDKLSIFNKNIVNVHYIYRILQWNTEEKQTLDRAKWGKMKEKWLRNRSKIK